jgi:ADP-ribose pyrophosphatase YjhB (NUDIX family)
VFNCGSCAGNDQHKCRLCGAINAHKSADCSYESKSSTKVSKSVTSAKFDTTKRTLVAGVIPVRHRDGKLEVLLQGRINYGGGKSRKVMALIGGGRERSETPWQTAVRECYEESGMMITIDQVLAVDDSLSGDAHSAINFIVDASSWPISWVKGSTYSETIPPMFGTSPVYGHAWVDKKTYDDHRSDVLGFSKKLIDNVFKLY